MGRRRYPERAALRIPMKLLTKYVHEVAGYGLFGGFAAQLVILSGGDIAEPRTQALVEACAVWLLAPSILVVGASGLYAMILRPTFFTRGWVWIKVFLTVPTVYPALATFPGVGSLTERTATQVWIGLVATIVITAFSVWRPKGILLD